MYNVSILILISNLAHVRARPRTGDGRVGGLASLAHLTSHVRVTEFWAKYAASESSGSASFFFFFFFFAAAGGSFFRLSSLIIQRTTESVSPGFWHSNSHDASSASERAAGCGGRRDGQRAKVARHGTEQGRWSPRGGSALTHRPSRARRRACRCGNPA